VFKTFVSAWKLPDIRKKLIYTLIVLLIYRIGCIIPVPFIDSAALESWFSNNAGTSILQYFYTIAGDSFSKATLFALSVSPYITSSIVMQLLTVAIPALERMAKEENGKQKIDKITRYVTVALAALMSYGYYATINAQGFVSEPGIFACLVIMTCQIAGASVIVWLAEKINENGFGQGISMILFVNILSTLPTMATAFVGQLSLGIWSTIIAFVAIIIFAVAVVTFVVFMTNSERRIPVQYAKRVVGRKMYGGQSTFLPLKLNMTGVMPIIFASTIAGLPATLQLFFPNLKEGGFWAGFFNVFGYGSIVYGVLLFVLIIAFSYFYLAISFNPVEVANNLKKNGGFIPGLRPGKPTSDFIANSLKKITLIGGFFLGIIAIIPLLINAVTNIFGISFGALSFGGTSLLIVVSVALETVRELETQITMRHYKGFLE